MSDNDDSPRYYALQTGVGIWSVYDRENPNQPLTVHHPPAAERKAVREAADREAGHYREQ